MMSIKYVNAPSSLGVVIDDKSWQPWYNYYIPYHLKKDRWSPNQRWIQSLDVEKLPRPSLHFQL